MGGAKIYLIGSLRNPHIPQVAAQLRAAGYDVFCDWFSAGEHADDAWRDHERIKGNRLKQALQSPSAKHVFQFDKKWLEWAEVVVLVCPAGKSGHLELGWSLGRGVPGFVLLDGDPDRYDCMLQFATGVAENMEDLLLQIRQSQYGRSS